jgi:S-adenosylmethionine-diacylglycerol 3-amino-3-carboxypropyl transferase
MRLEDASRQLEQTRSTSGELVGRAVLRNSLFSRQGLSERAFTLAFSSLVYPQIWEDPLVDLEALELGPIHRMITIASGGCNVLSYLSAAPAHITAVDLNTAHVALNRLKLAAARHLPGHAEFARFFAGANSHENVAAFDLYIKPHLDADTLAYWSARDLKGRRRIERFARNFYKYGLLGRFIAMGHAAAKLFGKDPRRMMTARTREEQIAIYEADLAPLFEKPLVKSILDRRSSLFGLGIPPAQYDALSGGRPMHEVIEERLRRLATGFDLKDNYFAWQAFNRAYAWPLQGPLPPYLEKSNFDTVREGSRHVHVRHVSFTTHLAHSPAASFDRYVLLDAQDWMGDEDLTSLWREITRTAAPGARVIFRTAGEETILPGRVPASILSQWRYEAEKSRDWTRRDRSAIYGGFHLYIKEA